MRRTGTGHDRSAIYDTSMCLAVLTPSLARVRHWSCPDRLPSDTLEEHFDQRLLAVDDSLSTYKHSATQRCLAQWEEKILRLREARSKRKRNSASSSNDSEQPPFFPLLGNHNTAGLDSVQHDVSVHSEPRLLAVVEPYQNTGGGGSISQENNQSTRLSECPNLSENPTNNRIAHNETKPDNSFNLCDGTRTLSDNQTCWDPSRALDPTPNLKWHKSACAVNLRPDGANCAGEEYANAGVNNQNIQSQESSSLSNYPMILCPSGRNRNFKICPCPSNGYWNVGFCPSKGNYDAVSCLRDGGCEVPPCPSHGDCEVTHCSSDGDSQVGLNPSDGNVDLAPCPSTGEFKVAPRLSDRDCKSDIRPSEGDCKVALSSSIEHRETALCLSHEDSKVASYPSDGGGQVTPCISDGDYQVVPWPSDENSDIARCPGDGHCEVSPCTSDANFVIAPGTSDGDYEIAPCLRDGDCEIAPCLRDGDCEIAPCLGDGDCEIAPCLGDGDCEIAPCLRDGDCEIAPCLRDGDCEIAELPRGGVGAISSSNSCLLGDANSDGISEASQVDSCPNCSCCVDNGLFPVKSFPSPRVWEVSVQKLWLRLVTLCSYIITCSWVLSRCPKSLNQVKHLKGRPAVKLSHGSTGALYGFCLLFPLLLLVPIQANDEAKDPVCVGNINIKDNLKDFLAWKHCKVLEGSLMINMFNRDFIKHNQSQMQNVSLPELTEITDFLLLYRADQIVNLTKILPKLAVIRGNKLTNNYALVIYRMKFMTTISLPSLTHIVKGGVKIEKNPNLCYVDTIDWKKIVDKDWHDDISIEENSEEERCPKTCPLNCPSSGHNEGEKCWNAETCQKLIVNCPDGTDLPGQRLCYSVGGSEITRPCDKQCLGGCSGTTREDCISCKNMKFPNPNNNSESFGCREKCPDLLLSYMNWTCITEDACMSKSTCSGSLMENKVVPYKILRNSMGDQCVEECPGNYEAKEFNRDGRIINECVECKDCPKICIGENIKSHESAKSFSGCTIIDGDLEIKVSKSNIMTVLEENLGKIKVIKGSLRITRSKSLVSLHFFKSLEEIQGRAPYDAKEPFAIEILENENLQKLFEENKNISISGKAFIHYNPQLCRKEITKLVSASGIDTGYDSEHLDISDTTNGDKAVCSELELTIRAEAMGNFKGVTILLIHFENFEKFLAKKKDADVRSLLGYNIYYREINEEQYAHKNLTKYEGREACGGEIWEIINQRKSDSKIIADNNNGSDHSIEKCKDGDEECFNINILDKIEYPDETSFISQLKPYTPYAIYVSTLMTKPFSGLDATGAQSKIIYVRTLVGIPEPVRKLVVTATSTSSGLEVSWEPPRKPNGILDHYDVIVEFNPLQEAFIDVDWCGEKKRKSKNSPVIQKIIPKENNTAVCPKSECPVCKNGDVNPKPVEEEDHIDDAYVEDAIINTIFSNKHHEGECNSKRMKRSAKQDDEAIENVIGISASKQAEDIAEDVIEVNLGNEVKSMLAKNVTIKTGEGVDDFYFTKLYTQVGGNETHLKVTIDHLKHYGQYSVKVRACHAVEKCKHKKHGACKRCSKEEEIVRKTMAKPKADDIVNPLSESRGEAQLLIAVGSKVPNGDGGDNEKEDKADTSTGGETYIRWLPPQAPNEMITMYKLRMKKDLADESDEHVNCISFNDPKITAWEERQGWVQYKLTWAGSYYISLKAVSLYGEGAWTSYQWAQVQTDSDYVIYIVLVVILLALLMSFGLGVGMVYKKRRADQVVQIVSINPEYIPTSEVYVVDEWEVPREVIETQEELGKGSFGMVYRGIYHHHSKGDLNVAIKTVNDQATLRQRIEFLNEASVMKDFDTEHVVKLVGVVSQGQPTLVLMELMDVGDLKNYLRTLRPNSDENIQREREGKEKIPPPTVKQIEKMALDIADGMAYLSVKKCIHRDLAARNCMVNNDITVKVGDFGMARDVYETEYYRKEGKGLLPVRWMAPESLRDGVFTSQSDVWSYGVVLWEMSTLAEQPYQGLANDQVVFYVKEGNVMEKPENCPEKLHGLMSDCWQRSASQRPTFLEICDRLLEGQDQSWVQSFVNNSFYHSSAGREAVANETNLKAARREADELASNNPETPLTTTLNHVNKSDNGHLPGEEHPLVPIGHTWKAEQFVRTNIENEKGERSSRISSRSPGSNGPSQLASGEGSNGPSHLASNESSRSSKLSMNAVNGLVQRLRNKSGSASGEA